jgi:hypothetical protein
MLRVLRRLANNKQFKEGAAIHQEDFKLPFEQNMNLLTAMFETRKWFIFNTPHKYYAEKYTNEMNHLHNELNYQQSRLLLKRGLLVFALIYSYFWFIDEPDAIDWKDTFDLKFSQKVYGSMTSSAGEGGASIDD